MNENANPNHADRPEAPRETPRRRWLKRGALGALVAGLAAGLGFRAFAHRGDYGRGPLDPAELDTRIERMLKHLYVEIDATDAQKAQLAPIAKRAAADLLPLRERMRAARSSCSDGSPPGIRVSSARLSTPDTKSHRMATGIGASSR